MALLGLSAACARGQAAPMVEAAVSDVVTGGYWQADTRGGHYRVVVTTVGFEALSSRVFVEWIAEPAFPEESPSVVASVEAEASAGEPLTWKPGLQVVTPGCVRIVLRGTHSMAPTRHPERAYWALKPGQLMAATRTNRPEACRNRVPAAPKAR